MRHAVDAFGRQVDRLITDAEDDVDVRVAFGELGEARNDEWTGERDGNINPQTTLRDRACASEQVLCRSSIGEDLRRPLVEQLPLAGQTGSPYSAMKETHADLCLQRIDRVGHARPARAERLGGPDEATIIDDGDEDLQLLDDVHAGGSLTAASPVDAGSALARLWARTGAAYAARLDAAGLRQAIAFFDSPAGHRVVELAVQGIANAPPPGKGACDTVIDPADPTPADARAQAVFDATSAGQKLVAMRKEVAAINDD